MKCLDFREIVDSYLSDELLTETNHEVLRHLEACPDCRGEIQDRRVLRDKLKSAVKNSEIFQIRDEFYQELHAHLRQSSKTLARPRLFLQINKTSWMAIAACLVLTFGLSFWFLHNKGVNSFSTETAGLSNAAKQISLENLAVGDHQNCAVKFNLAEDPIDIDLASAEYANLRQIALNPLQNAAEEYKFDESHTCKFQGRDFTHIVFLHRGKKVSVLLTDLQNIGNLKNNEMIKTSADGYQIARFDVKDQAVFVVSDLSEQENSSTAKLLESSARRQFSVAAQTNLNSFVPLKINY